MSNYEREYWIVITDSGDHLVFETEYGAKFWSSTEQEVVHVREVSREDDMFYYTSTTGTGGEDDPQSKL